MIDSYSFGRIVIDGNSYTSDIILYPDKIDDKWWRLNGHLLQIDDLRKVIKYYPKVLIVGTGAYGLMEVPDETKQYLESQGIKVIAEETKEACKTYNKLKDQKKVVAVLHLTC